MSLPSRPGIRCVIKSIVLLIALSFVCPYLTWAFDQGNFSAAVHGVVFNQQPVRIPANLGTITRTCPGENGLVIYVQDLHCNLEVQQNIAGLIRHMVQQHGLSLVAVEGASNRIHVGKLATFPNPAVRKDVGLYFVKEGKMSGPEYYAAVENPSLNLQGVEKEELYQADRESIRQFLNEESQGGLYDLKEALDDAKEKLYNPELKAFDQHRTSYQEGKQSLLNYCEQLCRSAQKTGCPLTPYPQLTAYVSKGLNLFPLNVDSDQLFREMDQMDQAVRGRLYRKSVERDLDDQLHRVEIMERILNISATPAELAEYRNRPDAFKPEAVIRFLEQYNPESDVLDTEVLKLNDYLKSATRFYQVADQRSQCFVDNTLGQMAALKTRLAVLVTGGYHSDQVMDELQRRRVAVIAFKPRLTQVDLVNPYYSLLRERKTPLEKLLAQNQNIFALPSNYPVGAVEPAEDALPETSRIFMKRLDAAVKKALIVNLLRSSVRGLGSLKQAFTLALQSWPRNNQKIAIDWDNARANENRQAYLLPVKGLFTILVRLAGRDNPVQALAAMAFGEYEVVVLDNQTAQEQQDSLLNEGGVFSWERVRTAFHNALASVTGVAEKATVNLSQRVAAPFRNLGQSLQTRWNVFKTSVQSSGRQMVLNLGAPGYQNLNLAGAFFGWALSLGLCVVSVAMPSLALVMLPIFTINSFKLLGVAGQLITEGKSLRKSFMEPIGRYSPELRRMVDPKTGLALFTAPWYVLAHEQYAHRWVQTVVDFLLRPFGRSLAGYAASANQGKITVGYVLWNLGISELLAHGLDWVAAPLAMVESLPVARPWAKPLEILAVGLTTLLLASVSFGLFAAGLLSLSASLPLAAVCVLCALPLWVDIFRFQVLRSEQFLPTSVNGIRNGIYGLFFQPNLSAEERQQLLNTLRRIVIQAGKNAKNGADLRAVQDLLVQAMGLAQQHPEYWTWIDDIYYALMRSEPIARNLKSFMLDDMENPALAPVRLRLASTLAESGSSHLAAEDFRDLQGILISEYNQAKETASRLEAARGLAQLSKNSVLELEADAGSLAVFCQANLLLLDRQLAHSAEQAEPREELYNLHLFMLAQLVENGHAAAGVKAMIRLSEAGLSTQRDAEVKARIKISIGQHPNELESLVAAGEKAVIDPLVGVLQPGMDAENLKIMGPALTDKAGIDAVTQVLQEKPLTLNPRLAYLVLQRQAERKEILKALIENPSLDMNHRLYAFNLFAARHLKAGEEADFKALADSLARGNLAVEGDALHAHIQNLLGDQARVVRMFNEAAYQNEDLKVYIAAVWADTVRNNPELPLTGFEKIAQVMSRAGVVDYEKNAFADFKIGGQLIQEAKGSPAAFLLLVLAHELGHNILSDGLGFGCDSHEKGVLHEYLADALAKTFAGRNGVSLKEFEAILQFQEHYEEAAKNNFATSEVHADARALQRLLEGWLKHQKRTLSYPLILTSAFSVLQDKSTWGLSLRPLFEKILNRYSSLARPLAEASGAFQNISETPPAIRLPDFFGFNELMNNTYGKIASSLVSSRAVMKMAGALLGEQGVTLFEGMLQGVFNTLKIGLQSGQVILQAAVAVEQSLGSIITILKLRQQVEGRSLDTEARGVAVRDQLLKYWGEIPENLHSKMKPLDPGIIPIEILQKLPENIRHNTDLDRLGVFHFNGRIYITEEAFNHAPNDALAAIFLHEAAEEAGLTHQEAEVMVYQATAFSSYALVRWAGLQVQETPRKLDRKEQAVVDALNRGIREVFSQSPALTQRQQMLGRIKDQLLGNPKLREGDLREILDLLLPVVGQAQLDSFEYKSANLLLRILLTRNNNNSFVAMVLDDLKKPSAAAFRSRLLFIMADSWQANMEDADFAELSRLVVQAYQRERAPANRRMLAEAVNKCSRSYIFDNDVFISLIHEQMLVLSQELIRREQALPRAGAREKPGIQKELDLLREESTALFESLWNLLSNSNFQIVFRAMLDLEKQPGLETSLRSRLTAQINDALQMRSKQLDTFVASGEQRVLDFWTGRVEPVMTPVKKRELDQALAAEAGADQVAAALQRVGSLASENLQGKSLPASNPALAAQAADLQQRGEKLSSRAGFLILRRQARRPDILRSVIANTHLDMDHRLYAFHLAVQQLPAGDSGQLLALARLLGQEALHNHIARLRLDNQRASRMLSETFFRDEELRIYAAAVWAETLLNHPELPLDDFQKTAQAISQARFEEHLNNVHSSFLVGVPLIQQAKAPADFLINGLTHELMHNILENGAHFSYGNGILHEFLSDVLTKAAVERYGPAAHQDLEEYERILEFDQHYHEVLEAGVTFLGSHTSARALDVIFRMKLKERGLDLEYSVLMDVAMQLRSHWAEPSETLFVRLLDGYAAQISARQNALTGIEAVGSHSFTLVKLADLDEVLDRWFGKISGALLGLVGEDLLVGMLGNVLKALEYQLQPGEAVLDKALALEQQLGNLIPRLLGQQQVKEEPLETDQNRGPPVRDRLIQYWDKVPVEMKTKLKKLNPRQLPVRILKKLPGHVAHDTDLDRLGVFHFNGRIYVAEAVYNHVVDDALAAILLHEALEVAGLSHDEAIQAVLATTDQRFTNEILVQAAGLQAAPATTAGGLQTGALETRLQTLLPGAWSVSPDSLSALQAALALFPEDSLSTIFKTNAPLYLQHLQAGGKLVLGNRVAISWDPIRSSWQVMALKNARAEATVRLQPAPGAPAFAALTTGVYPYGQKLVEGGPVLFTELELDRSNSMAVPVSPKIASPAMEKTYYVRRGGDIRIQGHFGDQKINVSGNDSNDLLSLQALRATLEELKQQAESRQSGKQTVSALVGYGNLNDLPGYVAYVDGRFVMASNEIWQGKEYIALTVEKDGRTQVQPVRLASSVQGSKPDRVLVQDGDGRWSDATDRLASVATGTPLAARGKALTLSDQLAAGELQDVLDADLRHYFVMPKVGNGFYFGRDQLSASEGKLVRQAAAGKPVTLDLKVQGRELQAEEVAQLERSLASLGYSAVASLSLVDQPGAYRMDQKTGKIAIRFKPGVYPHNLVYQAADGTTRILQVEGLSGRRGTSLADLSRWLVEEQGARNAFLLDNGGDVTMEVEGVRVVASSEKQRATWNAAVAVLRPAQPGPVTETEGRKEQTTAEQTSQAGAASAGATASQTEASAGRPEDIPEAVWEYAQSNENPYAPEEYLQAWRDNLTAQIESLLEEGSQTTAGLAARLELTPDQTNALLETLLRQGRIEKVSAQAGEAYRLFRAAADLSAARPAANQRAALSIRNAVLSGALFIGLGLGLGIGWLPYVGGIVFGIQLGLLVAVALRYNLAQAKQATQATEAEALERKSAWDWIWRVRIASVENRGIDPAYAPIIGQYAKTWFRLHEGVEWFLPFRHLAVFGKAIGFIGDTVNHLAASLMDPLGMVITTIVWGWNVLHAFKTPGGDVALTVKKDPEEMSEAAAAYIAKRLNEIINLKGKAVLGLVSGSTPQRVYELWTQHPERYNIDWSKVQIFHTDEFIGMTRANPASRYYQLNENYFKKWGVPARNIHFPNGMGNSAEEARKYEAEIAQAGGVDIQMVGIGRNGHIAGVEPGVAAYNSRTGVMTWMDESRQADAEKFGGKAEAVPEQGISMGLGTMLDSGEIILLASGEEKAVAVAKAMQGPITRLLPASVLRLHAQPTMFLDAAAAQGLNHEMKTRLEKHMPTFASVARFLVGPDAKAWKNEQADVFRNPLPLAGGVVTIGLLLVGLGPWLTALTFLVGAYVFMPNSSVGRKIFLQKLRQEFTWPNRWSSSVIILYAGLLSLGSLLFLFVGVISPLFFSLAMIAAAVFMIWGVYHLFKLKTIVAVDGWDQEGKQDIAMALAENYGYTFVDVSLIYRSLAMKALDKKLDPDDPETVDELRNTQLRFEIDHSVGRLRVYMDNREVTLEVNGSLGKDYTEAVVNTASRLGKNPALEAQIKERLLQMGAIDNLVVVGQNVGNLLDKQAKVKIYVAGDLKARAERLLRTRLAKEPTLEELTAQLEKIKAKELASKQIAPSRPQGDALVIDTTRVAQGDAIAMALAAVDNQASMFAPIRNWWKQNVRASYRMFLRAEGMALVRRLYETWGDVWVVKSDVDNLSKLNLFFGKKVVTWIMDDINQLRLEAMNQPEVRRFTKGAIFVRDGGDEATHYMNGKLLYIQAKYAADFMRDYVATRMRDRYRVLNVNDFPGGKANTEKLDAIAAELNLVDPRMVRVTHDAIYGTQILLRVDLPNLNAQQQIEALANKVKQAGLGQVKPMDLTERLRRDLPADELASFKPKDLDALAKGAVWPIPTISAGFTKSTRSLSGERAEYMQGRWAKKSLTQADLTEWVEATDKRAERYLDLAKGQPGKNSVFGDNLKDELPEEEAHTGESHLDARLKRLIETEKYIYEDNPIVLKNEKNKNNPLFDGLVPWALSSEGLHLYLEKFLSTLQYRKILEPQIFLARAPPEIGPDKVWLVVVTPDKKTCMVELEGRYFGERFLNYAFETQLVKARQANEEQPVEQRLSEAQLEQMVREKMKGLVIGQENGQTEVKFSAVNNWVNHVTGDEMILAPQYFANNLMLQNRFMKQVQAGQVDKALRKFAQDSGQTDQLENAVKELAASLEKSVNTDYDNLVKVHLSAVFTSIDTSKMMRQGVGGLFEQIYIASLAKKTQLYQSYRPEQLKDAREAVDKRKQDFLVDLLKKSAGLPDAEVMEKQKKDELSRLSAQLVLPFWDKYAPWMPNALRPFMEELIFRVVPFAVLGFHITSIPVALGIIAGATIVFLWLHRAKQWSLGQWAVAVAVTLAISTAFFAFSLWATPAFGSSGLLTDLQPAFTRALQPMAQMIVAGIMGLAAGSFIHYFNNLFRRLVSWWPELTLQRELPKKEIKIAGRSAGINYCRRLLQSRPDNRDAVLAVGVVDGFPEINRIYGTNITEFLRNKMLQIVQARLDEIKSQQTKVFTLDPEFFAIFFQDTKQIDAKEALIAAQDAVHNALRYGYSVTSFNHFNQTWTPAERRANLPKLQALAQKYGGILDANAPGGQMLLVFPTTRRGALEEDLTDSGLYSVYNGIFPSFVLGNQQFNHANLWEPTFSMGMASAGFVMDRSPQKDTRQASVDVNERLSQLLGWATANLVRVAEPHAGWPANLREKIESSKPEARGNLLAIEDPQAVFMRFDEIDGYVHRKLMSQEAELRRSQDAAISLEQKRQEIEKRRVKDLASRLTAGDQEASQALKQIILRYHLNPELLQSMDLVTLAYLQEQIRQGTKQQTVAVDWLLSRVQPWITKGWEPAFNAPRRANLLKMKPKIAEEIKINLNRQTRLRELYALQGVTRAFCKNRHEVVLSSGGIKDIYAIYEAMVTSWNRHFAPKDEKDFTTADFSVENLKLVQQDLVRLRMQVKQEADINRILNDYLDRLKQAGYAIKEIKGKNIDIHEVSPGQYTISVKSADAYTDVKVVLAPNAKAEMGGEIQIFTSEVAPLMDALTRREFVLGKHNLLRNIPWIITIDGGEGPEKYMAARLLAGRVNYRLLDIGFVFRAVVYAAQTMGVDIHQPQALAAILPNVHLRLNGSRIVLVVKGDKLDITDQLRFVDSEQLSVVSKHPAVIEFVRQAIQKEARQKRLIVVGRNASEWIGDKADVKFYFGAEGEQAGIAASDATQLFDNQPEELMKSMMKGLVEKIMDRGMARTMPSLRWILGLSAGAAVAVQGLAVLGMLLTGHPAYLVSLLPGIASFGVMLAMGLANYVYIFALDSEDLVQGSRVLTLLDWLAHGTRLAVATETSIDYLYPSLAKPSANPWVNRLRLALAVHEFSHQLHPGRFTEFRALVAEANVLLRPSAVPAVATPAAHPETVAERQVLRPEMNQSLRGRRNSFQRALGYVLKGVFFSGDLSQAGRVRQRMPLESVSAFFRAAFQLLRGAVRVGLSGVRLEPGQVTPEAWATLVSIQSDAAARAFAERGAGNFLAPGDVQPLSQLAILEQQAHPFGIIKLDSNGLAVCYAPDSLLQKNPGLFQLEFLRLAMENAQDDEEMAGRPDLTTAELKDWATALAGRLLMSAAPSVYLNRVLGSDPSNLAQALRNASSPLGQAFREWARNPDPRTEARLLNLVLDRMEPAGDPIAWQRNLATANRLSGRLAGLSGISVGAWDASLPELAGQNLMLPAALLRRENLPRLIQWLKRMDQLPLVERKNIFRLHQTERGFGQNS